MSQRPFLPPLSLASRVSFNLSQLAPAAQASFNLANSWVSLHSVTLIMSGVAHNGPAEHRYSTGELVRRLLALAWQFRRDCLLSVALSLALLLLGLLGLQLLGVVIDVIRHALDPLQR